MPVYCLVVSDVPLVAQDLGLMLQDLTGCEPIIATGVEAACDALGDLAPQSLLYAFIHADQAGFAASPLRSRVERLGARVVLLGHSAEIQASEATRVCWPVLAQPFGPTQVSEMLDRLGPEAGTQAGAPA